MKRVNVAAAVIYNASASQILISFRAANKHQGNLWEFPGGKIETGESARDALSRELKEELDIIPLQLEPLLTTEHDYLDKQVKLHVWTVSAFEGSPQGMEQQDILWVPLAALHRYDFPAANKVIVDAIAEKASQDH